MVSQLASPPASRRAQRTGGGRVAVWFVAGCCLALGMYLTALALTEIRPAQWPAWWAGGLTFVGLELVVHLLLQVRGQPSFYNGRG